MTLLPDDRAVPASGGRGVLGGTQAADLDRAVARVLTVATWTGVAFVALGTLLMLLTGVSPLDPAPALAPGALVEALLAGRPAGPLGVGIVILVAGPALRVLASGVGYVRGGERRMTLIAIGIGAVIVASVLLGLESA